MPAIIHILPRAMNNTSRVTFNLLPQGNGTVIGSLVPHRAQSVEPSHETMEVWKMFLIVIGVIACFMFGLRGLIVVVCRYFKSRAPTGNKVNVNVNNSNSELSEVTVKLDTQSNPPIDGGPGRSIDSTAFVVTPLRFPAQTIQPLIRPVSEHGIIVYGDDTDDEGAPVQLTTCVPPGLRTSVSDTDSSHNDSIYDAYNLGWNSRMSFDMENALVMNKGRQVA